MPAPPHVNLAAGLLNLTVPGDADWELPITYKDSAGAIVQLGTGWTAEFVAVDANGVDLLVLTTEGASIVLGNTAPNVRVKGTREIMALIPSGLYSYDLVLKSASAPDKRLIRGWISVTAALAD